LWAGADELALRLRLAEDALVDVEADRDRAYRQRGRLRDLITDLYGEVGDDGIGSPYGNPWR
jgi:hypothetical protein